MEHSFTFTLDRRLAHDALKRDHRWRPAAGLALLVVAAIVYRMLVGRLDAIVFGMLVLGALLVVVVSLVTYRALLERTHQLWRRQAPDGSATLRADDAGFVVESGRATVRYAWGDLRRLWRFPDAWLLEIVKQQSVVFPPTAASAEALTFIEERCRQAGVRV